MKNILIFLFAVFMLASCSSTLDRIKNIGKEPNISNLDMPNFEPDEEDVITKQKRVEEHKLHVRKTNSLWKPGSNKFVSDNRSWNMGDIIRVVVEIDDNATLRHSTKNKRSNKQSLGIPNLFGGEKDISKALAVDSTDSLLSTNSGRDSNSGGDISRNERIRTEIAATVIKILQNGNLLISGHQEIRVNDELREIKVAGIIRPKDISSNNSVNTNQIAEARISYGGRGTITNMQKPRIGNEIIDILSPF